MTLKELFGSRFYNYPFDGTVERSSFTCIKNRFGRNSTANPIIRGQFCELNGATQITIRATYQTIDIVIQIAVAVAFLIASVFVFADAVTDSLSEAWILAIAILPLGAIFLLFSHFWFLLNAHVVIGQLKKALQMQSM